MASAQSVEGLNIAFETESHTYIPRGAEGYVTSYVKGGGRGGISDPGFTKGVLFAQALRAHFCLVMSPLM